MYKIKKDRLDKFQLPYCQTNHCLQSDTVEERMVIFQTSFPYVTREWLIIACTRNIKKDDIYVYVGKDFDIERTLRSYRYGE